MRAASAAPLEAFIADAVEPGVTVRTDDWSGYRGLAAKGYAHRPTPMRSPSKNTAVVLPRVPRVFSLRKRGWLSTHQGAVRHSPLDYYLDFVHLSLQPPHLGCARQTFLPPAPTRRRG